MSDWLSFTQILGYLASAILIAGYAIKSDKKTKTILIFSSLFFTAHFFLLGALTAAIICAINAIRNVTSIFYHGSKAMFFIFMTVYILSGYFTYQNFIDVLPLTAAILTCAGMFLLSGVNFRVLIVIAALLWIVHNVVVGSIGGTINSVILFFVSSTTVIRLYRERKKKNAV